MRKLATAYYLVANNWQKNIACGNLEDSVVNKVDLTNRFSGQNAESISILPNTHNKMLQEGTLYFATRI